MKTKVKIFAPIIFAINICLAQTSTFSFNINGTAPTGFAEALTIAGERWSKYLYIPVQIKVNVVPINVPFLPFSAIALSNGRANYNNAPVPNTLYPTALANQIAGTELNPGEYDMDIYVNTATNYFYGSTNVPAFQTDFISTAMHEIGHGLGFYSAAYVDNNGLGSFGNVPPTVLSPVTTTFPWRGQDSMPTIYDRYIVRNSNNLLLNTAAANSTALADSIKTGPFYFSGPVFANFTHSNTPIRLAGGNGFFAFGEDLLHIHNTYANTIMSYYWGVGDTVRTPAPWEIGILREIGWNLKPVGIVTQSVNEESIISYPNPVNKMLNVFGKTIKKVKLVSLLGQVVFEVENSEKSREINIEVAHLKDGIYFLECILENGLVSKGKKIVISH